jgi:citrate lyase beta subunit
MRARRTLLYVPGSDWRKIEKAAGLGADCVCLDLEDGVAPNRKDEARQLVVRAMRELDFGRSERLIRINAIGGGNEEADFGTVLAAKPDGVVLPKAADAKQVQLVAARLPGLAILAQIESALGLVNVKEIAASSPALEGLIFGSEDFASDVGAIRTPEAEEIFYARSAVVTHASAFGLQAIDMLHVDFKDTEGLVRLATQGAHLGYSGMQIVHPDQIEPVRKAFTPNAEQVAAARRLVTAFEENERAGRGAFALDGKMVDMPLVKAARRVLARADEDTK